MTRLCCLGIPVLFALSSILNVSHGSDTTYKNKCDANFNEMLNLSPREFDQDFDRGWASLADIKGCKRAAANLIPLYYSLRDLPEHIEKTLKFHEAQLRAELEQPERAVSLFQQTRTAENNNGWNYYVDGTIAFLTKDYEGLEKAINHLEKVEKPEGFDPRDSEGQPIDMEWPPNLKVLERFKSCFEETYLTAYAECKN